MRFVTAQPACNEKALPAEPIGPVGEEKSIRKHGVCGLTIG